MPPLVGGPGGSAPSLAAMIQAKRDAVLKAADPAAKAGADLILERMQARLDRGVGTNDRAMAPYRAATARRKGRSAPVTLRGEGRGGHMRAALKVVREARGRYVVRLTAKQDVGRYLQLGTSRMTARPWFGATVRDAKAAAERMGVMISESTRRGDRRVVRKIVVMG